MSDDFVLNVRQIGQYPRKTAPAANDALLIQNGGIGGNAGDYSSMTPADLVAGALDLGGNFRLAPGSVIAWNGATLGFAGGLFTFTEAVSVPTLKSAGAITIAGQPVATQAFVLGQISALPDNVSSFNGRHGDVLLSLHDILSAGGAQLDSPFFIGNVRAPTPWNDRQKDNAVATTEFVWNVVNDLLCNQLLVFSFNGRGGHVILTTDDVNAAYFETGGTIPRAPHPSPYDSSNRIATTGWATDLIHLTAQDIINQIGDPSENVKEWVAENFAPLVSPQLSGTPTAPTATPGSTTGQIATTAFVMNAVSSATAGVSSFNTRTGAVTLITADVTAAGGAPIASPALTGNPTAPTPTTADSDTSIATTAFVHAVAATIPAGVTSFNARTGAVTLTTSDITGAGGAPTASPAFSGVPAGPTASAGTATTQLATTAFVMAAVAAGTAGVTSWNGRTGAVTLQGNDVSAAGGALVASPTFTGTPSAPTAAPGTNTQQIATTAFVMAAVGGGGVVSSFNGRTGAVTLTTGDITGAGGAPVSSPALTGTPTAPTPAQSVNDTTLATTAYVRAAITSTTGVASFNGRTGTVALLAADITGAGGALLASPSFTGTPQAPTASPGLISAQLANCAFVMAAIGASVTAFNGRTGAVSLIGNDIAAAGGAMTASPSFSGTPLAPTPTTGTSNTQIATTAFVQASIQAMGGVTFAQGDTAVKGATTLWFNSANGQLYVNYLDPTTSAPTWVMANSPLAMSASAYVVASYTTAGAATFTTPADSTTSTKYRVRMVGGGGGGGGRDAAAVATVYGSGGGSAGGIEGILTGVAASTAITLNVAAAGPAGNPAGTINTPGGNSTLTVGGTTVTCSGGTIGSAGISTNNPGGIAGAPSVTGTGFTTIRTQVGMSGQGSQSVLGAGQPKGGDSMFGAGGIPGCPPSGQGTGGAGATTAGGNGQAGTNGMIIIERIAG